MAIVQDAFDIPEDIMVKLLTGEYRRIGGVIRVALGPNKGQIVTMLDSVDLKAPEEAANFGAKVLRAIKEHKKGVAISGLVLGAAIVGGIVYYNVKNHEAAVLTRFRGALRIYLDQIRKGTLDVAQIDALMQALNELRTHKDYDKFKVELSAEDLDVLVNRIYEYTMRLAENNNIILDEEERTKTNNSIVNLQNYLKTQKRIFEMAS